MSLTLHINKVQALRKEAEILQSLNHPNIIKFYYVRQIGFIRTHVFYKKLK